MIMPFVNDLAQEITRQVNVAGVTLEGPISVRDNSVVFRARVEDSAAADMAVKCCRDAATGRPDAVEAKRQFDALRRVGAALRPVERHCRVPSPLFFSERLGAYGMSWVDGESLTARMARKDERESLLSAFEQAGAWLGTLHRVGQVRQGAADLASKLEHMRAMQLAPVRHDVFRHALSLLVEASRADAASALRISWLHGDCKTDNFMLVQDGIVGIDISLGHENSVEHDLAQFLNNFDLLVFRPGFRHLLPAAAALRDAFMRGYRGTGLAVSAQFLYWMRLWSGLTLWHTTVYERPSPWPKRWLVNRMFASLVSGLVGERESAQVALTVT